MAKFTVLQPIKHDGEMYADGKIELTAKQAAPLLAVGAIADPAARPAKPVSEGPIPDPEADNGAV